MIYVVYYLPKELECVGTDLSTLKHSTKKPASKRVGFFVLKIQCNRSFDLCDRINYIRSDVQISHLNKPKISWNHNNEKITALWLRHAAQIPI